MYPPALRRALLIKSAVGTERFRMEENVRAWFQPRFSDWMAGFRGLTTRASPDAVENLTGSKRHGNRLRSLIETVNVVGYEWGAVQTLDSLGFRASAPRLRMKAPQTLDFILTNKEILDEIRAHADEMAEHVVKTTTVQSARTFADVLETGGAINEGRNAIAAYLKDSTAGWRSWLIANTEFQIGIGRARWNMFDRAGVTLKQWVTVGDDRVRETHVANEAEGWIPFRQRFSNGAMFPGDGKDDFNCFVDGRIKVLTDTGEKRLDTIVVGDRVMTHKGVFCPVQRLFRGQIKKGDPVVFVRFGKANSVHLNHFTVTPEHPFLTERGWVAARDLEITDRLFVLAKACRRCGERIPFYRDYCSRRCLSLDITDKQWKSDSHRIHLSQSATRQMHREYATGVRNRFAITKKARAVCLQKYGPGLFGQFMGPKNAQRQMAACLQKYGKLYFGFSPSVQHKSQQLSREAQIKRLSSHGWRTEIEVADHLKRHKLDFLEQFCVGSRHVDFYVPKLKLFVEADGCHWHRDLQKDRKRDLEILLQYPDHSILHCVFNRQGKLETCLLFDLATLNHAGAYEFVSIPITQIKHRQIGRTRPLYNLSVADNESFVANGVVVHNCRCILDSNVEESGVLLEPWTGE